MGKFVRRGIALVCTIMMVTNPLLAYAEEAVQQEKQPEENIQDIENEKDESQEENSENIYKEEQDKTTEVENGHKELDVLPEEENTETEQEVMLQEDVSKIYGRQVININKGWDFTSNDNTTVGWSFPKGGASGTVDLPHCWEYVHPTQSYIPQRNMKTVTYTKIVDISEMKNRNLFLKFYGSSRNTEVLIDGEKVGTHIGGYSAFVFDISKYVKDKDQIIITANVTNLDTTSIPINVDYTQWAGIYRDVELIATGEQYFSTEDYGNEGIYIDSTVNGSSANIKLRTEISNTTNEEKNLKVVTEILDANGNCVAKDAHEVEVQAETLIQSFESNYTINEVHLWNGTSDPYLYTMNVKLCDEAENELDEVSQKFGVRTYEIKDGKFFLNGNEYEIHGVGMHQDREGYGNAVPNELKAQDMNLMQEMGVNAIRTAHYPHDQYIYDMADERGMIVYCEIPYYLLLSNAASYQKSVVEELKEMIRQGYNHPSIMMWGILNEVAYSELFASFGPDFRVDKNTIINFNRKLAMIAQEEDTGRYIVQAQIDAMHANEEAAEWSKNGTVDFTGVNLYVGFKSEVPSAGDVGRKLITTTLNDKINQYKQLYNTNSFMITEYGAGANVNHHTSVDEAFSWSISDETKDKHYEEYQSYLLETYYKLIQDRGDIPVSFVWNMFDFSCYRNEGGLARTNTKGLVCYNHETRKDAFYFYKANWNKEDKFVYLTSKRYIEREKKNEQIKVYSNCENVELFVNGKSIGNGNLQQSGVFVWDDVVLDEVNDIRAVGIADGQTYEDEATNITVSGTTQTSITYQAHVEDYGWMPKVMDGVVAGTTGERKRMEAIKVKVGNGEYAGSVEYRTHVENKGWTDWVKDGKLSGTSGEFLRMEAIQLRLTGELAENYDVYYRVHAQEFGWLDWAKNGEQAGTAGYAYRLEGIQIQLVKKGGEAPGNTGKPMVQRLVKYQSHVQDIGDCGWVYDGELSGSVGRALRMEAIRVTLPTFPNSSIKYSAHVENIGWQKWIQDGGLAGTKGKALRLEGIKLQLSEDVEKEYDIYYQVHVENLGWLDWAKNGEPAGSQGFGYRMEGIRIELVKKGEVGPGNTARPFMKK